MRLSPVLRLTLVLAGLAAAAPALIARAWAAPVDGSAPAYLSTRDKTTIDKANAFLETMTEVKGRFTQTSPRGGVSTGELYMQRPGKARFAYDPQFGLLVVADGRWLSVYDSHLKTFDQAPLNATPLALLLAPEVHLERDEEMLRVDHYADGFALTLRDAKHREEGYIVLTFNDNPVVLRGWTVTDAQGQATEVQISGLQHADFEPDLFVLHDPRAVGHNR